MIHPDRERRPPTGTSSGSSWHGDRSRALQWAVGALDDSDDLAGQVSVAVSPDGGWVAVSITVVERGGGLARVRPPLLMVDSCRVLPARAHPERASIIGLG